MNRIARNGTKITASVAALVIPAALLTGVSSVAATDQGFVVSNSSDLNPGLEVRAGIPKPGKASTVLSATRKKKNTLIKVTGIRGQATATWKDGRKNRKKTSKRATWVKQWKFTVSKKVKKIKVTGSGMAPIILKVPRKSWAWRSVPSFNPIKPNGGKATSYKFLTLSNGGGRIRFDPCTYTTERDDWRGKEIVTSAVNNKSTITWNMPKGIPNSKLIRDSVATVNKHVGWNLKEVASNSNADINMDGYGWNSGDDYSWNADGVEYHEDDAPNKVRVVGVDLYFVFGSRVPASSTKRMIMQAYMMALGLNKVDDDQQIMYKKLLWGAPAYLGAGDIAGLKRVGPSQGCVFSVGDVYPE